MKTNVILESNYQNFKFIIKKGFNRLRYYVMR